MRSPCRPKKNVLENLGYVHTEKKKRNQKDNVERYREMTKINELIILAPPLEECYPLPEHLLPFLQSIFIRQVLLLFGRETLAKVWGFFKDHHFGGPIRCLQIRNEGTEELESVAQIHSTLALHRIVLGALLTAIFRIGSCAGPSRFAGRPPGRSSIARICSSRSRSFLPWRIRWALPGRTFRFDWFGGRGRNG